MDLNIIIDNLKSNIEKENSYIAEIDKKREVLSKFYEIKNGYTYEVYSDTKNGNFRYYIKSQRKEFSKENIFVVDKNPYTNIEFTKVSSFDKYYCFSAKPELINEANSQIEKWLYSEIDKISFNQGYWHRQRYEYDKEVLYNDDIPKNFKTQIIKDNLITDEAMTEYVQKQYFSSLDIVGNISELNVLNLDELGVTKNVEFPME